MPGNRARDVYEHLRTAIVEGEIRPNERLIESDLAERLHVSRTPVRESLLRLGGDGLIVSRRRGWAVREHSAQEIREAFEVRAALEGFAARLAAERASDADLHRIETIHRTHIEDLGQLLRGDLLAHNDVFHEAVIAAAGNALLSDQIRRNAQHYFVRRISGFLSDDQVRASIAGHDELVRALVARDANRAENAARSQLLEHLESALSYLD